MAVLHTRGFSRLPQLLAGVLPDRLEQSVADWLAFDLRQHQRLVHQLPQQAGDLAGFDRTSRADRLGRLQRPASHEHRQPPQERPLGLG
jgi:hypothetical protein